MIETILTTIGLIFALFSIFQMIALYVQIKYQGEIYKLINLIVISTYILLKLNGFDPYILIYAYLFTAYKSLEFLEIKRTYHYLSILFLTLGFFFFLTDENNMFVLIFVVLSNAYTLIYYLIEIYKKKSSDIFSKLINYIILLLAFLVNNEFLLLSGLFLISLNIFLYVKNIYDNYLFSKKEEKEKSHIDKILNPTLPKMILNKIETVNISINFNDAWEGS